MALPTVSRWLPISQALGIQSQLCPRFAGADRYVMALVLFLHAVVGSRRSGSAEWRLKSDWGARDRRSYRHSHDYSAELGLVEGSC
ncbi:hypothetical protein GQ53DRAFT_91761 [Thozetella sp. PMI_491]|nr:hypothetical protein GQ53DRAFT_91761 [Thozetella sp. PMI_491]